MQQENLNKCSYLVNFTSAAGRYCLLSISQASKKKKHDHRSRDDYHKLAVVRTRLARIIGNSSKLEQIGCLCLMRGGKQ